MSVAKVREYLKQFDAENRVVELDVSTATVDLAATALGVEGARIVKTLSFRGPDGGALLVCMAGDSRTDNRLFKDRFGVKARMLTPEEVVTQIGFEIGGVCPFGANPEVPVFIDEAVKRFDTVFPAAGSTSSMIELTPAELFTFAKATDWVNIAKLPD
jgi:prolyl-tRNA editing enzyme YbaK/EbsC (Cys-tRNA(Pro) deacylase)